MKSGEGHSRWVLRKRISVQSFSVRIAGMTATGERAMWHAGVWICGKRGRAGAAKGEGVNVAM
jgi:hypothetical protein